MGADRHQQFPVVSSRGRQPLLPREKRCVNREANGTSEQKNTLESFQANTLVVHKRRPAEMGKMAQQVSMPVV